MSVSRLDRSTRPMATAGPMAITMAGRIRWCNASATTSNRPASSPSTVSSPVGPVGGSATPDLPFAGTQPSFW